MTQNQSPEAFTMADPSAVHAIMLAQKAQEAELAAIRDRGHKWASATPIDLRYPPEGEYFTVIHGHRKRAEQIHTGATSTHFPMTFEGPEYARGMISEGVSFVPAKYWAGVWPTQAKHMFDNEKWGVLLTLPPGSQLEAEMFVHAVWLGILEGADTLVGMIDPKPNNYGSTMPAHYGNEPAGTARLLRLLAEAIPDDPKRRQAYNRAARKCDEALAEAALDNA